MKLSATDWSFLRSGDDPGRYYAGLAAAGYEAAETVPPQRWALVRENGLEVLNVSGDGMQWGLNRLEEHERVLPLLRNTIAAAGHANVPHVIVFSGNRRGASDEDGIHNCVKGLSALSADAQAARVTLLFEALNTVDHADYHAATSAFLFEVIRRVDAPSVRALYDVYHAAVMGEEASRDLRENMELIGHIHVAGVPGRVVPAAGQQIDYTEIVRIASEAGYNGYWGLEFLPAGEPLDELAQAKRFLTTGT